VSVRGAPVPQKLEPPPAFGIVVLFCEIASDGTLVAAYVWQVGIPIWAVTEVGNHYGDQRRAFNCYLVRGCREITRGIKLKYKVHFRGNICNDVVAGVVCNCLGQYDVVSADSPVAIIVCQEQDLGAGYALFASIYKPVLIEIVPDLTGDLDRDRRWCSRCCW